MRATPDPLLRRDGTYVVKDVDVVLNCVRADTLPASYAIVKNGGVIVSITGDPDAAECAQHQIRCSGVMAHPDAKVLEELTKLIEANKIEIGRASCRERV